MNWTCRFFFQRNITPKLTQRFDTIDVKMSYIVELYARIFNDWLYSGYKITQYYGVEKEREKKRGREKSERNDTKVEWIVARVSDRAAHRYIYCLTYIARYIHIHSYQQQKISARRKEFLNLTVCPIHVSDFCSEKVTNHVTMQFPSTINERKKIFKKYRWKRKIQVVKKWDVKIILIKFIFFFYVIRGIKINFLIHWLKLKKKQQDYSANWCSHKKLINLKTLQTLESFKAFTVSDSSVPSV